MRSQTYLILYSLFFFSFTTNVIAANHSTSTTTGFWQEMHRVTSEHSGIARSGKTIYQYRCKGCHGKNTQGAPMPGDVAQWQDRKAKGMSLLMQHTINGFGYFMPAKGGCLNCTDNELRAAIDYMMKQTSLELDFGD